MAIRSFVTKAKSMKTKTRRLISELVMQEHIRDANTGRFIAIMCFAIAVVQAPAPANAITGVGCGEHRAKLGGAARLKIRMADGRVRLCSGVLISDKAVLTAASCFKESHLFNLNSVAINIHLQRQNSTITPCITMSSNANQCGERLFQVLQHPNWVPDADDNEDNIAIVHIKSNKLRYPNRSIPTSDMARLYADKLEKSQSQLATGFGACNFQEAGLGEYRADRRIINISDIFDLHYRRKVPSNDVAACVGDHGGAAFLNGSPVSRPIVVGLLSSFRVNNVGARCAGTGLFERYVKVSPKVTWISNALETLSGRGCRPPFQQTAEVKYQLCFD